jgi:protein O-mannosyl-transferase
MTRSRGWLGAGAGLIVLVTLVSYIPAMRGGFIWDDDDYVINNPTLRTAEGLRRIWCEVGATMQYYPMVFSSFWAEYQLWGLQPFGYHLVNVLLHAANALLLWVVLRRLRVPGAWLAAAVFAVHPVHVESVAWITERKNVLSGFFYLAALLAYLRFSPPDEEARPGGRRWGFYVLAWILFAGALLSKTVTCTLPAALLILLWWKRSRLTPGDMLPLVPMFVAGAIMGLTTAAVEKRHVGAEGPEWAFSIADRFLIAGHAVWFYLGKLLWPSQLTFIYPRWAVNSGQWQQYVFPVGAVMMFLGLFLWRKRIGKAPFAALFLFIVTVAPALGFINIYPMRYSFVADHFQYLASIGPIALYVGLLTVLIGVRSAPPETKATNEEVRPDPSPVPVWCVPLAGVLVAVLSVLTWQQGRIYESYYTLWKDTLAKNPTAWIAHNNLGTILEAQGKLDEAAQHYAAAFQFCPSSFEVQNNLGSILTKAGKYDEAMTHLRQAVRIKPDHAEAYYNMGVVLAAQGKPDEAIDLYNEALRLRPTFVDALFNLGEVLRSLGKHGAAMERYRQTLQIYPNHAPAYCSLGILEAELGNVQEAIQHLSEAVRIAPSYADAHYNLALVLAGQGKLEGAAEYYREALRLKPDNATGHNNLGNILSKLGKLDEAVEHFREAVRLNPEFAEAHYNLAIVLTNQDKLDEAAREYREALRINPGNTAAHNNLANILAKQKKFDEAIYHLSEALRIQPEDAMVHNNVANLLIQQGKIEEGIGHLKQSIRIKPDYVAAHSTLGDVYEKQGRIRQAVDQYREVVRLSPNWLGVEHKLAWILATNESPEIRDGAEAVKLALHACEATKQKNMFALDTLAAAYAETGQFKEAVETAKKAIALARETQEEEAVRVIESRLTLYQAGRAYREPNQATQRGSTTQASRPAPTTQVSRPGSAPRATQPASAPRLPTGLK